MLQISPLLAWFFTFILLALAGRAAARLLGPESLTRPERNRELGHAAMGFGMAVLLVPGVPRPPQVVSVCFFAVLAALAALGSARRALARSRGRAVDSCAHADHGTGTLLLDPHHAIVGLAMVVMLLRPTGMAGMAGAGMSGMTGSAPGTTVLLLLAYVWIAALVLGIGMTRVLAAGTEESGAVLSSPATVYACELAMTVLTGLMLLS